jgi:hypothetical protein
MNDQIRFHSKGRGFLAVAIEWHDKIALSIDMPSGK